jgi:nucleoside-diphosphate-sugar epimerase
MATVLVTGATGFIGSALLRQLAAEGHRVVALHRGRLATMAGAGIEWHRLDLLRATEEESAALIRSSGATHCLHAAWYTDHGDYLVADINREWLAASLRFAQGFRAGGGSRFVALGTCLEYDQTADDGVFSELRTPLRPDTVYARCKAELFARLSEVWRTQGGSGAWARVFFVYGPGDRAGRLLPYIFSSLARGEKASARYGGLRRDYIHVEDLAGQLVRIALGEVEGPINTGTGEAAKIADIFHLAGALTGHPDLVEVNDAVGAGQAARIQADMDHFRAEIGAPRARGLREGLRDLAEPSA